MTDKQRDSINARAREIYGTERSNSAAREDFRAGASFALSLIQDDRLFEASKAAMQSLILTDTDHTKVAPEAVYYAKALLAVLEEEGK